MSAQFYLKLADGGSQVPMCPSDTCPNQKKKSQLKLQMKKSKPKKLLQPSKKEKTNNGTY